MHNQYINDRQQSWLDAQRDARPLCKRYGKLNKGVKMKKILSIGISILCLSSSAFGEVASPESVKSLMVKTGAGDMSIQMLNQMLPALKKMIPDAPEKFWQDIMSQVNGGDIINMTVPIYQKYLSQEDINALNAFYDSPTGKKMIKVQPSILRESMTAGQAWGQKIALDVMNKYNSQKP